MCGHCHFASNINVNVFTFFRYVALSSNESTDFKVRFWKVTLMARELTSYRSNRLPHLHLNWHAWSLLSISLVFAFVAMVRCMVVIIYLIVIICLIGAKPYCYHHHLHHISIVICYCYYNNIIDFGFISVLYK